MDYQFYILEEKKVGVKANNGKIIKTSEDGKFAMFRADIPLNEKQNIMLRRDDECIYAKVIRKENEGVVICFTSMTQNVST